MYRILIIIFLSGIVQSSLAQPQVRVRPVLVDSSFDEASEAKLHIAIALLDSIYNSEGFAQAVLAENFSTGNYYLSGAEILEIIRSGMDNYKDAAKDYSIDLRLKVYDAYKGGKEYGNTQMNSRITATHRCYILNNDVYCYVSHLAHEYMHEIGFYDVKSWVGLKRTKINSVPYKIGGIVSRIMNKKYKCAYQVSTCKK